MFALFFWLIIFCTIIYFRKALGRLFRGLFGPFFCYEIYERRGKSEAMRTGWPMGCFCGMLFLVTFILSGPYFVQRYGKRRAVAMLLSPVAVYLVAIGLHIGMLFLSGDGSATFQITWISIAAGGWSIVALFMTHLLASVWVMQFDSKWARKARAERGWTSQGISAGFSAHDAISSAGQQQIATRA